MSWKSSKQETVDDSTMETDYIVSSEATKEGVWLCNFIPKLGVVANDSSPLDLYCDHSGDIAQAKEMRSH